MNIGTFVTVTGLSGYGVILDTSADAHIVAFVLGKDGLGMSRIIVKSVHKRWISSIVYDTLSNHWNPRVRENVRRIQVKINRHFKRRGLYSLLHDSFIMDSDLVLLRNF
jgi:hypothetical protein